VSGRAGNRPRTGAAFRRCRARFVTGRHRAAAGGV